MVLSDILYKVYDIRKKKRWRKREKKSSVDIKNMIVLVMALMLISTSGLHNIDDDDGVVMSTNLRSQRFSQVWAATGLEDLAEEAQDEF